MINNNGVGWSKQLDEIRDLITLIDALPFWKRRKVWKDVQAGKLPDIPSLLRRISAECIKVKKCFWCRSDVETNQVTHGPDDSEGQEIRPACPGDLRGNDCGVPEFRSDLSQRFLQFQRPAFRHRPVPAGHERTRGFPARGNCASVLQYPLDDERGNRGSEYALFHSNGE